MRESRRQFLRGAAGVATMGLPLRSAIGQAGPPAAGPLEPPAAGRAVPSSIETVSLRDDLYLISGAGGNVVLLHTDAGAALVDTGSAERAPALSDIVAGLADGAAVGLVFNTHWHPEHTGGNDAYGAAGARIVAHENTRLWMSTEYYVDWQDRTYTPRAPEALPNDTFYTSDPQPLVVELGDERIEYGHLREAHTDGDIYVRFRDRNVIAAGGVTSAGTYPVPDYATGGWIGGLIDATAKLISLADADTLIVPGTGPAQPRSHLQRQHEMLVTVRERVEDLMRTGRSAEEMLAAGVTDEFDAAWGDNRERFVTNVYGGLWWVGRLTNSL